MRIRVLKDYYVWNPPSLLPDSRQVRESTTTSAFPSTDLVRLPTTPTSGREGTMTAALLAVVFFCAQPEHAIGESYTTGATKNYRSSGDSKRPAKVRMTIDEDSRNTETDPQNNPQCAIHPPNI